MTALACAIGCEPQSEPKATQGPSPTLERARQAYGQGDYRAAVIDAKTGVQEAPDKPESRLFLGKTYVSLRKGADAEKELTRALELGAAPAEVTPLLVRALLLQEKLDAVIERTADIQGFDVDTQATMLTDRGLALLGQRRVDEGEASLLRALGLNQELGRAQRGLAQVALARDKPDLAQEWIDKSLQTDPRDLDSLIFAGELAASQQNTAQALVRFEAAFESDASNSAVLARLITLWLGSKDFDKAQRGVMTLRQIAPEHPVGFFGEGVLKMREGKNVEAQAALEQAASRNPQDLRTIYFLGLVHYHQRHYGQAEELLAQFTGRVPNDSDAKVLLARIYLAQGQGERARSILVDVLRGRPDDAEALMLMGTATLGKGDVGAGQKSIQAAIAAEPDSALVRLQAGLALLGANKPAEGIASLEAALTLDPELSQAEAALVLARLSAGDSAGALEAAEEFANKQPDNPQAHNLLAVALRAAGKTEAAIAEMEQTLKRFPDDAWAARALAGEAVVRGDLDAGRARYGQVLQHHPKDLKSLVELAKLDAKAGDHQSAIAMLERAVAAHPQALGPRLVLARYYDALLNPQDALRVLTGAPGQVAEEPAFLLEFGRVYLSARDAPNAARVLDRYTRAKPDDADGLHLLAVALNGAGDRDRAREAVSAALAVNPGHPGARAGLATLFSSEEGRETVAKLRKAHPGDTRFALLQGWLLLQQYDLQGAISALSEAYQRDPGSESARALAEAQWKADRQTDAIATLKGQLGRQPEDSTLRAALAGAYGAQGKLEQARALWQDVIKRRPDDVTALTNLAWLMREKNPSEALQLANRVLPLAPDSPPVLDTVGVIHRLTGDAKESVRLLGLAAERAPRDAGVRFHLAESLAAMGNSEAARDALRKAVTLDPSFARIAATDPVLKALLPAASASTPTP